MNVRTIKRNIIAYFPVHVLHACGTLEERFGGFVGDMLERFCDMDGSLFERCVETFREVFEQACIA